MYDKNIAGTGVQERCYQLGGAVYVQLSCVHIDKIQLSYGQGLVGSASKDFPRLIFGAGDKGG
jgi:hypothetical protein